MLYSTNAITDYVFQEMNRECQQNKKQIYATWFVNRMKKVRSVLKKVEINGGFMSTLIKGLALALFMQAVFLSDCLSI